MSSTTFDVPVITPADEIGRDSFPEHVLAEIARTTGPQPLCLQSREILLAYWDRLGPERALAVTSAVFGEHGGFWMGAPVTPLRFQPTHDAYFSQAILSAGEASDS